MNTRSKAKAKERNLSDGNGSIANDVSDTSFSLMNGTSSSKAQEKIGIRPSKCLAKMGSLNFLNPLRAPPGEKLPYFYIFFTI